MLCWLQDQCSNVVETLSSLGVPRESIDGMVTAGNKMDLISPKRWPQLKSGGVLPVSATQGFGLLPLAMRVEERLLSLTGRRVMRVRCRAGSGDEEWIGRNATVTKREVDPENDNYALLSLVVSKAELGRIKKYVASTGR